MKTQIELNLSDKVVVDLTEHGYQVMNAWFDNLMKKALPEKELTIQKFIFLANREKVNPHSRRKFKFTLSELMDIFGKEMTQCFLENKLFIQTESELDED